jgi:hypothetical protein
MVFGAEAPAQARKLGKVTVVVDGKTALFAAPYDVPKRTMHVSGRAVLDGATWKLQVLDIETAIPDQHLRDVPVLAPFAMMVPEAPSDELGKAVAAWFRSKTLGKHAATGGVLAVGSAPDEISAGRAAVAFAASLDKLTLIPTTIEADPAAALVHGIAWMPVSRQERDGEIEFAFTIYAVKDGAAWKWRAIQFADDQVPNDP